MTIIDAHVHLWHQDGERCPNQPWLQGSLPPYDGTAERLIEWMDRAGVTAALNVQVPWYREDNRYYHEMAAKFPGRLALVGVLDPALPDAPARLKRLVREQGAGGFRIHFNEPGRREQLLSGKCDPVLAMAGELGVPVQCLARMPDMPTIQRSAAAFPGTSFIIDHLGHPDLSEKPPYLSSADFFRLGAVRNVYVKVSLLCDHSKENYPYPDVQEFVRHAIHRFGASRLMWGSNFPMIPEVRTDQPVDYKRSLELVREHWPWLGEQQKQWILGKTALSLWKFPSLQQQINPNVTN